MRAWIEPDIIFDCIFMRDGYEESQKVIRACESRIIEGCISALTLVKLSQALKKQLSLDSTVSIINDVCRIFSVTDFKKEDIDIFAIDSAGDFDKGLELMCARDANARYIVTNNVTSYDCSDIVPVTPSELKFIRGEKKGLYRIDYAR